MFVIMDEFSPWPPVNCNDCRNVSCTEAEQEKAMGKPPHICREYKKRVFHGTNKRGFHSCLHPCVDCIKDRFRKFESRGGKRNDHKRFRPAAEISGAGHEKVHGAAETAASESRKATGKPTMYGLPTLEIWRCVLRPL